MKIAIDIDDTLTDSVDYFRPFVAEYFGVTTGELKKRNISYANLPEEWKPRELAFYRAYFDRVVPETTFKPFAAKATEKLKNEGHEILIVTARTTDFYTDPYATTRRELENGKIVYDKLYCAMDKAEVCAAEGVSLMFDDMPHNCDAVGEKGIPAVLFTSSVNRDLETEKCRVADWNEAFAMVSFVKRGYPDRRVAESLLFSAEKVNPGQWGNHCRVAAACAEKIARACGMDEEKAYVLGLLHDIGRRFLVRDLGHIYNGYRYMKRLGFGEVAKVCLTHSFPTKNFGCYLGEIDIPAEDAERVRNLLANSAYNDYDRLIALCDALAGCDGVVNIEERMADVKRRYGNYPEEQWNGNLSLKDYFEKKAGLSPDGIYALCGK